MNTAKPSWNPWPWALITFFVILISCIAVMTTFAVRQRVDLVGADYYEQEIHFQQQIDRLRRTAAAAPATVAFDAARQRITLALGGGRAGARPTGTVHLYRPSDSRLDRDVSLAVDATGRQEIATAGLAPGLWKVRVNWTVGGEEFFRDQSLVLGPATP